MELIFEQYADRLRRKAAKGKRSPHTITGFTTAARRLSEWLADQGLTVETVTPGLLEEYFDTLPLSASSQATHLRHIRAAYNYAATNGRITRNPSSDLEPEEGEPRDIKIIPVECLRVIRDRIRLERDWLWFHLLAYTGMRRAEIIGLRWEEGPAGASVLDLSTQTIRVIGKGRKLRLVPVHPELGDVLTPAQREAGKFVIPSDGKNGVAAQTVQEMVKRLSPIYTPHDFRRTVNTSLRRNGVDESVRNRIMGWAPKDISGRYYDNVADPELHRGILRLYADDPL